MENSEFENRLFWFPWWWSVSYLVCLLNSPKVLVLKTLTGVKFTGGSKSLLSSEILGETQAESGQSPLVIADWLLWGSKAKALEAVLQADTRCRVTLRKSVLPGEAEKWGHCNYQLERELGKVEEASESAGYFLLEFRLGRTETTWSSPGKHISCRGG